MRQILIVVAAILALGCGSEDADWRVLFNGTDLENWGTLNGTAEYKIEDGVIIGVSQLKTPNTFLATKENFSDFILELDVWVDPMLNSGIQIRSNSIPEYLNGRVHGYQVEIDPSERAYSGGIYDEARRGWLYPLSLNTAAQVAFKNGDWNTYRIEAIGTSITTWVNGICTAKLNDNLTPAGFIGLQVHGINDEAQAGKVIKWKNVRIATEDLEELKWADAPDTYELNLVANDITASEKLKGWEELQEDVLASVFELSFEFKLDSVGYGEATYLQKDDVHGQFNILDHRLHADSIPWLGSFKRIIPANNLSWEPMGTRYLRTPGEWNQGRIVVSKDYVEHWLNSFKIVEYSRSEFDLTSPGRIHFSGVGVEFQSLKILKKD